MAIEVAKEEAFTVVLLGAATVPEGAAPLANRIEVESAAEIDEAQSANNEMKSIMLGDLSNIEQLHAVREELDLKERGNSAIEGETLAIIKENGALKFSTKTRHAWQGGGARSAIIVGTKNALRVLFELDAVLNCDNHDSNLRNMLGWRNCGETKLGKKERWIKLKAHNDGMALRNDAGGSRAVSGVKKSSDVTPKDGGSEELLGLDFRVL